MYVPAPLCKEFTVIHCFLSIIHTQLRPPMTAFRSADCMCSIIILGVMSLEVRQDRDNCNDSNKILLLEHSYLFPLRAKNMYWLYFLSTLTPHRY